MDESMRDELAAENEDMLFADGFDEALIGTAETAAGTVALYDRAKVLSILMERDGMTYEGALDFYGYNVLRALPYYGENAPIFADLSLTDEH